MANGSTCVKTSEAPGFAAHGLDDLAGNAKWRGRRGPRAPRRGRAPFAPSAPRAKRICALRAAGRGTRPPSPAVEVAGKIEQVNLEQRRAGIDRRPHAEAGDAAMDLAADRRADRIDAESEPIGRLERQIGGRNAERAAEPLAVGDDPGDDVVAAEAARRRLDVAALERAADRRGRNDFGAAVDRRLDLFDDFDRETEPRPGARRDRSGAPARPRPKWKSQPTTTAPTSSRATSVCSMNSSAVRPASAASKVSAAAPARPSERKMRALIGSGVRRKTTGRPAK